VENQLVDVLQSEVGPKGAARFGRVERFGKKDSGYELRNVAENDFRAQDSRLT